MEKRMEKRMEKQPTREREYARLRDAINGVTVARLVCLGFAIRHAVAGEWAEAIILVGIAYLMRLFLPVTR